MEEMHIHTRWTDDGVAILDLKGRLDVCAAPRVQQALCDLVEHNGGHVLVNMAGVDFIDSTGLTALMAGFQLAETLGGAVRLCCVQHNVSVVLQLTALDKLLAVYDDEASALASFPKREE
jgi:anti-anti-sigma factor